jgi:S1-C subfamily serine protease
MPGANARQCHSTAALIPGDQGGSVFNLISSSDATSNPGQSGIPLYERHSGEVLGHLQQWASSKARKTRRSGNPSGISFAFPTSTCSSIVPQRALSAP